MAEHLHFLGIGGHAMRGVAYAAQLEGAKVTGTDEGAYPPGSNWLDEHGIVWWKTPDVAHLSGVDKVVISGGVRPDHPELMKAQSDGIPVQSFPEYVAEQTAHARRIVVAGTHGKTTTTSLVTWLLEHAGQAPDYLIGITPHNFASSVRLQHAGIAVLEGDEYRASQLDSRSKFDYYRPDILIVTSIEMDHPDFFSGIEDIVRRFKHLIQGLPEDGRLIYCRDDANVQSTIRQAGCLVPVESYGIRRADWSASDISYHPEGLRFVIRRQGERAGSVSVPLFGQHNVLNTLAAAAAATAAGLGMDEIVEAAASFKGASRRFQQVSPPGAAVTVIDDYAHHPSEVATTIEAAKLHFKGRVITVFRPHTFSRTKELLADYRRAFIQADISFIGSIEGAREAHLVETVSGADIADGAGEHVRYVPERAALARAVSEAACPGDVVLSMTVNGYDNLAEELAVTLNKR